MLGACPGDGAEPRSTRPWQVAEFGPRIHGIHLDGECVGGTCFALFAAQLTTDRAVRVRGMSRVRCRVAPDDHAGIAVAERLGMSFEGVGRGHLPHRGRRPIPEVRSVLAEERTAGPQRPAYIGT
ncbi:GNAT family N-acetyltransferase [Streptomyces phaeoluteigriseus]|uniref:GNAT family N-acetyltransferase n=1 Tax=Streptomyces phaeoluteigriseus TaxID=114686 RepID=UPI00367651DF